MQKKMSVAPKAVKPAPYRKHLALVRVRITSHTINHLDIKTSVGSTSGGGDHKSHPFDKQD